MIKHFKWAEEPQRTPIIVITGWKEVSRVEAKVNISARTRILAYFHLAKLPEKQYWIGVEIKIKEPHSLYPNDMILLHDRHECAWFYLGIANKEHRITSMSCVPDMKPYTGPAVIIGQTFSEFNKNPRPFKLINTEK